jgi:hypothetical protein
MKNSANNTSQASVKKKVVHLGNPDGTGLIASSNGPAAIAPGLRRSQDFSTAKPQGEMGEQSKKMLDKLIPLIKYCKEQELKTKLPSKPGALLFNPLDPAHKKSFSVSHSKQNEPMGGQSDAPSERPIQADKKSPNATVVHHHQKSIVPVSAEGRVASPNLDKLLLKAEDISQPPHYQSMSHALAPGSKAEGRSAKQSKERPNNAGSQRIDLQSDDRAAARQYASAQRPPQDTSHGVFVRKVSGKGPVLVGDRYKTGGVHDVEGLARKTTFPNSSGIPSPNHKAVPPSQPRKPGPLRQEKADKSKSIILEKKMGQGSKVYARQLSEQEKAVMMRKQAFLHKRSASDQTAIAAHIEKREHSNKAVHDAHARESCKSAVPKEAPRIVDNGHWPHKSATPSIDAKRLGQERMKDLKPKKDDLLAYCSAAPSVVDPKGKRSVSTSKRIKVVKKPAPSPHCLSGKKETAKDGLKEGSTHERSISTQIKINTYLQDSGPDSHSKVISITQDTRIEPSQDSKTTFDVDIVNIAIKRKEGKQNDAGRTEHSLSRPGESGKASIEEAKQHASNDDKATKYRIYEHLSKHGSKQPEADVLRVGKNYFKHSKPLPSNSADRQSPTQGEAGNKSVAGPLLLPGSAALASYKHGHGASADAGTGIGTGTGTGAGAGVGAMMGMSGKMGQGQGQGMGTGVGLRGPALEPTGKVRSSVPTSKGTSSSQSPVPTKESDSRGQTHQMAGVLAPKVAKVLKVPKKKPDTSKGDRSPAGEQSDPGKMAHANKASEGEAGGPTILKPSQENLAHFDRAEDVQKLTNYIRCCKLRGWQSD